MILQHTACTVLGQITGATEIRHRLVLIFAYSIVNSIVPLWK